MYEETDLTYAEKDQIFTNYLTLLYRIYPGVKSVDSDEFNKFSANYSQLYRKGNRDIYEPLDIQEQELQKLLNPKVETKPLAKAKEPEPVVVEAPPPGPSKSKPVKFVNAPKGTETLPKSEPA